MNEDNYCYLKLKAELLINGLNATPQALSKWVVNIKSKTMEFLDGILRITQNHLC
jgi:hypothetical protein